MVGQRFGKLTVIEQSKDECGCVKWVCQCDCGNITVVRGSSLRSGGTKSCGCKRYDKLIDLTGKTFGNLKVVRRVENSPKSNNARWECVCEKCGNTVVVVSWLLMNSDPDSHCGCSRKRMSGESNPSFRHGKTGTKLYRIWAGMHNRCTNTNQWNYQYYGGRGIKICEEWKDFVSFQDWALKNGYEDGLSIDRIDPDGHYEACNCRWVLPTEQQGNRRPFNPHKQSINT